MKKIYTKIVVSFLLCAGLVSCEMKDEILGKDEIPSETGLVELGISVDDKINNITKSAEGGDVIQGTSIDPSDYPVTFTLQGQDYIKSFNTYKELLEANPVELPIGTYIVDAHTPGSLQKRMADPFYAGEINLKVEKDLPSTGQIVCTMQNSRIKLTITDAFAAAFLTWTITIDDGSESALSFTQADGKNPEAVYWVIDENCKSLQMNVTATNTKGDQITESRSITKPDGAADMNWVGGDALNITMEPGPDPEEPEEPTGVSGIIIKISAFFETEDEETVEIPIETTPTEPEEPTDPSDPNNPSDPSEENKPTLSGEYLNKTVTFNVADGLDAFPAVEIKMSTAPEKIKSVVVSAETDNTILEGILNSIGFGTGVDLVTTKSPILEASLGTLPSTEESEYTFSVNGTIKQALAGSPGNHKFTVVITDQKDQSNSGYLAFSITGETTETE